MSYYLFYQFSLYFRLASCCSHAAAVLFSVELYVRNGGREGPAVTEQACAWMPPSRKEVQPAPLRDISFKKPKKLGRPQKDAKGTRRASVSPKGM